MTPSFFRIIFFLAFFSSVCFVAVAMPSVREAASTISAVEKDPQLDPVNKYTKIDEVIEAEPKAATTEEPYDGPFAGEKDLIIDTIDNIDDLKDAETQHEDDSEGDEGENVGDHERGSVGDHERGSVGYHEGGNVGDHEGGNVEDHEGPNVADHESGNVEDHEGGNLGDHKGGNVEDHEGGNLGDHKGGNVEDHEGGNVEDHEGSNVADHESPNVADYEGPNVADYEGPKVADHEGPNVADHEGPNVADYEGPSVADYEGPKVADHEGGNLGDHEGGNLGDHEGGNLGDHEGGNLGDHKGGNLGDNEGKNVGDHEDHESENVGESEDEADDASDKMDEEADDDNLDQAGGNDGDYNEERIDDNHNEAGGDNDGDHDETHDEVIQHHYYHHHHELYNLPPLLRPPPPYAMPHENEDGTDEDAEFHELDIDADFPPSSIVIGSATVCFTNEIPELNKRCKRAAKWGTSVYVMAFNRTGSKVIDNGEEKSNYELFDDTWYDAVAQLKNETGLNIRGLVFEMDHLEEKLEALNNKTDVYDGFLINWETQKGACYSKVPKLNTSKEIAYIMAHQDWENCDGEFDVFVNNGRRSAPIPDHIKITFPCFGGLEGRCFRSFTQFPEDVCGGTNQTFAFTPFERASAAMWFLLQATCENLKKPMPPYIFAQAV